MLKDSFRVPAVNITYERRMDVVPEQFLQSRVTSKSSNHGVIMHSNLS